MLSMEQKKKKNIHSTGTPSGNQKISSEAASRASSGTPHEARIESASRERRQLQHHLRNCPPSLVPYTKEQESEPLPSIDSAPPKLLPEIIVTRTKVSKLHSDFDLGRYTSQNLIEKNKRLNMFESNDKLVQMLEGIQNSPQFSNMSKVEKQKHFIMCLQEAKKTGGHSHREVLQIAKERMMRCPKPLPAVAPATVVHVGKFEKGIESADYSTLHRLDTCAAKGKPHHQANSVPKVQFKAKKSSVPVSPRALGLQLSSLSTEMCTVPHKLQSVNSVQCLTRKQPRKNMTNSVDKKAKKTLKAAISRTVPSKAKQKTEARSCSDTCHKDNAPIAKASCCHNFEHDQTQSLHSDGIACGGQKPVSMAKLLPEELNPLLNPAAANIPFVGFTKTEVKCKKHKSKSGDVTKLHSLEENPASLDIIHKFNTERNNSTSPSGSGELLNTSNNAHKASPRKDTIVVNDPFMAVKTPTPTKGVHNFGLREEESNSPSKELSALFDSPSFATDVFQVCPTESQTNEDYESDVSLDVSEDIDEALTDTANIQNSLSTSPYRISTGHEEEDVIDGVGIFSFKTMTDMMEFAKIERQCKETVPPAITPRKTKDVTKIKGWRSKTFCVSDNTNQKEENNVDATEVDCKIEACNSGLSKQAHFSTVKHERDTIETSNSEMSENQTDVRKSIDMDPLVEHLESTAVIPKEEKTSAFVSDVLEEYLTLHYKTDTNAEDLSLPQNEETPSIQPLSITSSQKIDKPVSIQRFGRKPKTLAEKRRMLEEEQKKMKKKLQKTTKSKAKGVKDKEKGYPVVHELSRGRRILITRPERKIETRNLRPNYKHFFATDDLSAPAVETKRVRRKLLSDLRPASEELGDDVKPKVNLSQSGDTLKNIQNILSSEYKSVMEQPETVMDLYSRKTVRDGSLPRNKHFIVVVHPVVGRSLQPLAIKQLKLLRKNKYIVDSHWAQFAASVVVTRDNPKPVIPPQKILIAVPADKPSPFHSAKQSTKEDESVDNSCNVNLGCKNKNPELPSVMEDVRDCVDSLLNYVVDSHYENVQPAYDPDFSVSDTSSAKIDRKNIEKRKKRKTLNVVREMHRLNFSIPESDVAQSLPCCGQEWCRLGCVCDSILRDGPVVTQHCGLEKCMFECTCPSGNTATNGVRYYSNGKVLAKEEKEYYDIVMRAQFEISVGSKTEVGERRLRREIKLPERYRDFSVVLGKDIISDPHLTTQISVPSEPVNVARPPSSSTAKPTVRLSATADSAPQLDSKLLAKFKIKPCKVVLTKVARRLVHLKKKGFTSTKQKDIVGGKASIVKQKSRRVAVKRPTASSLAARRDCAKVINNPTKPRVKSELFSQSAESPKKSLKCLLPKTREPIDDILLDIVKEEPESDSIDVSDFESSIKSAPTSPVVSHVMSFSMLRDGFDLSMLTSQEDDKQVSTEIKADWSSSSMDKPTSSDQQIFPPVETNCWETKPSGAMKIRLQDLLTANQIALKNHTQAGGINLSKFPKDTLQLVSWEYIKKKIGLGEVNLWFESQKGSRRLIVTSYKDKASDTFIKIPDEACKYNDELPSLVEGLVNKTQTIPNQENLYIILYSDGNWWECLGTVTNLDKSSVSTSSNKLAVSSCNRSTLKFEPHGVKVYYSATGTGILDSVTNVNLPVVGRKVRWFMTSLHKNLSVLHFKPQNVVVGAKQLEDLVQMAQNKIRTCRIALDVNIAHTNRKIAYSIEPKFGIYSVYGFPCVIFAGPFEMDENYEICASKRVVSKNCVITCKSVSNKSRNKLFSMNKLPGMWLHTSVEPQDVLSVSEQTVTCAFTSASAPKVKILEGSKKQPSDMESKIVSKRICYRDIRKTKLYLKVITDSEKIVASKPAALSALQKAPYGIKTIRNLVPATSYDVTQEINIPQNSGGVSKSWRQEGSFSHSLTLSTKRSIPSVLRRKGMSELENKRYRRFARKDGASFLHMPNVTISSLSKREKSMCSSIFSQDASSSKPNCSSEVSLRKSPISLSTAKDDAAMLSMCKDPRKDFRSSIPHRKPPKRFRSLWLVPTVESVGYLRVKYFCDGVYKPFKVEHPLLPDKFASFTEPVRGAHWISRFVRNKIIAVPSSFTLTWRLEKPKVESNLKRLNPLHLNGKYVLTKQGIFNIAEIKSANVGAFSVTREDISKARKTELVRGFRLLTSKMGEKMSKLEVINAAIEEIRQLSEIQKAKKEEVCQQREIRLVNLNSIIDLVSDVPEEPKKQEVRKVKRILGMTKDSPDPPDTESSFSSEDESSVASESGDSDIDEYMSADSESNTDSTRGRDLADDSSSVVISRVRFPDVNTGPVESDCNSVTVTRVPADSSELHISVISGHQASDVTKQCESVGCTSTGLVPTPTIKCVSSLAKPTSAMKTMTQFIIVDGKVTPVTTQTSFLVSDPNVCFSKTSTSLLKPQAANGITSDPNGQLSGNSQTVCMGSGLQGTLNNSSHSTSSPSVSNLRLTSSLLNSSNATQSSGKKEALKMCNLQELSNRGTCTTARENQLTVSRNNLTKLLEKTQSLQQSSVMNTDGGTAAKANQLALSRNNLVKILEKTQPSQQSTVMSSGVDRTNITSSIKTLTSNGSIRLVLSHGEKLKAKSASVNSSMVAHSNSMSLWSKHKHLSVAANSVHTATSDPPRGMFASNTQFKSAPSLPVPVASSASVASGSWNNFKAGEKPDIKISVTKSTSITGGLPIIHLARGHLSNPECKESKSAVSMISQGGKIIRIPQLGLGSSKQVTVVPTSRTQYPVMTASKSTKPIHVVVPQLAVDGKSQPHKPAIATVSKPPPTGHNLKTKLSELKQQEVTKPVSDVMTSQSDDSVILAIPCESEEGATNIPNNFCLPDSHTKSGEVKLCTDKEDLPVSTVNANELVESPVTGDFDQNNSKKDTLNMNVVNVTVVKDPEDAISRKRKAAECTNPNEGSQPAKKCGGENSLFRDAEANTSLNSVKRSLNSTYNYQRPDYCTVT